MYGFKKKLILWRWDVKKVFSQEKKENKKNLSSVFLAYSDLLLPSQEERGFRECFLAPPPSL